MRNPAVLSVALYLCANSALAQQPTRLPPVVVSGVPDLPGPRKIAGIVRDTFAIPLDSVEISIVTLQRRLFSKSDGTFRFENVAPGEYEVRARRIGFAPQIRTLVVDTAGGSVAFMLVPITQVLRPVVTTVSRGGLSGVVGDTAFNALVGAQVKVLGHEQHAVTDSSGAFYIPIRPGSYMVSVKQPGFDYRLLSVIVPADSGQRVRVTLAPMTHKPTNRQVHNVDDFGERLAWRSHAHTRVYTHAELVTMNVEWVWEAVRQGFNEIHVGPNNWIDQDCSVVVNGGPEITTLETLTVDDVESVEIYDFVSPPLSAAKSGRPPARRPGMPIPRAQLAIDPVPLSNAEIAVWSNMTKKCTLVYVWLR